MKRKKDSVAFARVKQKGKQVKGEVNESESQELDLFAKLPSAITTHILLQLPIKSIATSRCVRKSWNALTTDPHFAKLYLECSPHCVMILADDPDKLSRTIGLLEPEMFRSIGNNPVKLESAFTVPLRYAKPPFEKGDGTKRWLSQLRRHMKDDCNFGIVNSCNGILCYQSPWRKDSLVVCNPLTGEFITLPKANKTEKNLGRVYVGFGFQPKTNEYKVVRILQRDIHSKFKPMAVKIHTLGKSTWRNVGVDNEFSVTRLEFPTCLNGALHWISFDGWQRSILCFNFDSESFLSFPSPPRALEDNEDIQRISMAELEGFLYICDASSSDSCIMWVMKNYGVGGSWTKVFSIDNLGEPFSPYALCWPVKHYEKGASILMQRPCNCFVYYEPEEHGFKVIHLTGTRPKLFKIIPYIPSLISLKHAVKGDNIEVLNAHSWCAEIRLRERSQDYFDSNLFITRVG